MVLEPNSNVYGSRYNKTTIPTTSLLGNLGKSLDLRQHPWKCEAHHSYTRLLRCSVIMRAPGHISSNNNVKNHIHCFSRAYFSTHGKEQVERNRNIRITLCIKFHLPKLQSCFAEGTSNRSYKTSKQPNLRLICCHTALLLITNNNEVGFKLQA